MEQADDLILRKYLLGQLDAAERDALEKRLLADPELADLLEALGDELLSDYVRGELSREEQEHFVQYCLPASSMKENEPFEHDFQALITSRFSPAGPVPAAGGGEDSGGRSSRLNRHRIWLLAAAVLFCAAGILLYQYLNLFHQYQLIEAARQEVLAREQILQRDLYRTRQLAGRQEAELAGLRQPAAGRNGRPGDMAGYPAGDSLVHLSGLHLRGGEAGVVIRPPRSGRMYVFGIPLASQSGEDGFSIQIETVAGETVLLCRNLRPASGRETLELRVPGEYLPAGDYILVLFGKDGGTEWLRLQEHSFRVSSAAPAGK